MALTSPRTQSWDQKLTMLVVVAFGFVPLLLAFSRAGADIVITGIGVLFLVRSAFTRQWEWLKRPDIMVLTILWLYLMASALTASDPSTSLIKSLIWGRMVLFFAAATSWILVSSKHLSLICRIILPTLLFLMVDTAWQYITSVSLSGNPKFGHRLSGPLSSYNIGNLLLKTSIPVLCFWFYRAYQSSHKPQMLLSLIGLMAIAALVVISGERSIGILMFLGMSGLFGFLFLYQPKIRKYVFGYAAIMAAIITLLFSTQIPTQQRSAEFLKTMSSFWDSHYGELFRNAYALWKEHPITGLGVGGFRNHCDAMMEKINTTHCAIHPHNIYLEWLSETGIIGLVLFITAMAIIVQRFVKHQLMQMPHILAAGSVAMFIILLFPIIGTQSAFANWPAILFWFSLSMTIGLSQSSKNG